MLALVCCFRDGRSKMHHEGVQRVQLALQQASESLMRALLHIDMLVVQIQFFSMYESFQPL